MSDQQEPNLEGDGANSYSSSFQRTVVLRDWWLIKCSNEFEGKRFGVAGIETTFESRAMRVFTSSPIIKALDVFTLKASNGICITLRGFLNKERLVKNGFKPEISREFIFGFPPCWERICNDCFQGDSVGTDINIIDKVSSPILSPCKYSKGNLVDNPAESRDKSTVTEMNISGIDSKYGSRARDRKNARRKALRLQPKSGGKSAEEEWKYESSKVQKTTNDGEHSNEVEKDDCEATNNEDIYSKVQNCTSDEDHGSEGFDKAKSIGVEKDECEAINDEVISPADGYGRKQTVRDNVDNVTSTTATGESLTSEHGKKRKSKKSKKTLKVDGNVVELMNHSRTTVRSADKNRKFDVSKIQNPTTSDGDHGSEGLNKARSGACDVSEDECEAINNEGNENELKLDDSKVQNCNNDGDHGSEGLDKAKSSSIKKDVCVAIDYEVILPADVHGRKHSGADNVDKVTSRSATGDSLTSEQRKGELKVTTASPQSLFKDFDKSSKPGRKRKSKKNEKTRKGNAVEPMYFCGTKDKGTEKKRNLDASKIQNPTTNHGNHGSECVNKGKSNDVEKYECVAINKEVISRVDGYGKKHSGTDGVEKLTSKNATRKSLTSEQRKGKRKGTKTSLHSPSKDINNSSKPGKNRKSKKSEKTLKSDSNVVEPMHHSGSEVKEDLSWGKTKRKIDFDVEVTSENESKKQKTNVVSTDSVGQKRSRSGRLLVSSLEFWRNQIPVYDMDRNLIQVKKGSETKSAPSKGN